jgi:hypothetical protein
MRANRAYDLLVRREGHGPAFLARPGRLDHVEIVEIETGEVVLFWDTDPRRTGRLARALRADLAALDARDFLERWQVWETS